MPDFHGLFDFYISQFGKLEIFANNTNVITLIDGSVGLMIIMLTLNLWMPRTFFKEVFESTV